MAKNGNGLSRQEQHFARIAESFTRKGVRADNIAPGTIDCVLTGYDAEGDVCCLCGHHNIKWLFLLRLGLTTGGTVTFEPVGSTCIEQWVNGLPIGQAQQEIIGKLALALAEANALKARFRAINGHRKTGRLPNEQADALIEFYAAPKKVRDHPFLRDVADKVVDRYGGFTDRQWAAWERVFKGELHAADAPVCGACGAQTRYRSGKFGEFWGCSNYPGCRWTQNIKNGERSHRRGKKEETPEAPAPLPPPDHSAQVYDDLPF